MNRHWLLLAASAFLLPAAAATAAEEAKGANSAADPARAQQIVSQVCAACHGADGNSPSPANPSLAGQSADYITRQLAHFKAGVRPSPIMQPMAAPLSDADMAALGAYFAQQKPKGQAAKDATDQFAPPWYPGRRTVPCVVGGILGLPWGWSFRIDIT